MITGNLKITISGAVNNPSKLFFQKISAKKYVNFQEESCQLHQVNHLLFIQVENQKK